MKGNERSAKPTRAWEEGLSRGYYIAVWIAIVIAVAFLSACGALGGGPENVALDFTKAIYQEQDFAKARLMCLRQQACDPTGLDDMEDLPSWLGDDYVVTNFEVGFLQNKNVTSADKASGITERVWLKVTFAYKSDKTQGRFKNWHLTSVLVKYRGQWKVESYI